jgi:metal-sulfur cluster biosynthetic enzyme
VIDKKSIMKELDKVLDPEIGIPITAMNLIDNVKIDNDKILIEFHLSMPYCPPMFATEIGKGIKKATLKVKGIKSVQVKLKDHYMAEEMNKEINM